MLVTSTSQRPLLGACSSRPAPPTGVSHRSPCVHCAAASSQTAAPAEAANRPRITVIPNNGKWRPSGVPPVMGAHLMASGTVAPISTSKGAGIDVPPHEFQYPTEEGNASILLYASPAQAGVGLAKLVADAAQNAIKAKDGFTLVLSGGSLVNSLAPLATQKGIEWDKWHVFWVDERVVPLDSADSNYKGAVEAFLSKVPIPAAQIYAIGEGLTASQAAVQYEGRLLSLPQALLPRGDGGLPEFDLILLGVGPDGHVASLFPNHPQVAATERWVLAVEDSPKPPPQRITLSLPVINAAQQVAVLALGEGKAEIVQRVLEVQSLPGALPAQLVRPTSGNLKWLLDVASAQTLNMAEWDEKKAFPRSL